MKNSFRTNLVGKCIKIFLNKQFSHNIFEHAVPKRRLFIMSPYLAITSLYLRTHLQRSINSNISFCKIKIIFKSSTRLANFFRFKDMIPLRLRSNIVYKFTCGSAMLPIMLKHPAILKLKLVNTQLFHL